MRVDESSLRVCASIDDENKVWLTIASAGVRSDLGVYGPYDTRDAAEVAAREAVAHAARQIQMHKTRILAELIEV